MNEAFIQGLFPELSEIQDDDLRAKSVAALKLAMERGGWTEETVHLAPVSVSWENVTCGLIEHIRKVTQVCMSCFELLSGYYEQNGSSIDRDTVVCGALLHDIGKFTEFALKDGVVTHSDNFNLLRHPLGGAIMAAEVGLPDKIVHLIGVHSFEGDKSYQTAESKFVRILDLFVFDNSVYGLKKKQ